MGKPKRKKPKKNGLDTAGKVVAILAGISTLLLNIVRIVQSFKG